MPKSFHEFVGWIGSIMFAICGIPQVVSTFRTHDVSGLSFSFILLWFLGEIFSATYLIIDDVKKGSSHFPIYFNYVVNLACVSYLLYALIRY